MKRAVCINSTSVLLYYTVVHETTTIKLSFDEENPKRSRPGRITEPRNEIQGVYAATRRCDDRGARTGIIYRKRVAGDKKENRVATAAGIRARIGASGCFVNTLYRAVVTTSGPQAEVVRGGWHARRPQMNLVGACSGKQTRGGSLPLAGGAVLYHTLVLR